MMGRLLRPFVLFAPQALAQIYDGFASGYGVPTYSIPHVEAPHTIIYEAPQTTVYGSSPYGMPMEVHYPPPIYSPPVDVGALPQMMPPVPPADVPHPEVIAEEQRRNLAQAKQNLDVRIKELTEANENHKKSIAEQANRQIEEYAKQLNAQVQQTLLHIDAQLKAEIDGLTAQTQAYEQRLQEEANRHMGRHREKLVREAAEKAHQEYRVAESHAKAELEEQLKSARQHQGSEDWASRANARYNEQIQQLQQAMQASIQHASQLPVLPVGAGEPQSPDAPQAPQAPAALALEQAPAALEGAPAALDDTN